VVHPSWAGQVQTEPALMVQMEQVQMGQTEQALME